MATIGHCPKEIEPDWPDKMQTNGIYVTSEITTDVTGDARNSLFYYYCQDGNGSHLQNMHFINQNTNVMKTNNKCVYNAIKRSNYYRQYRKG